MSQFRYILERGSKKHICPSCNQKKYVRYIDIETNEYIHIKYGRCDREAKCSYNLNPYNDNSELDIEIKHKPVEEKRVVFFDVETFEKTLELERYEHNTFLNNLLSKGIEAEDITIAVELYLLGTISKGYRKGGLTIPFIDIDKNIRAVQVKQFDENNHTTSTDFLHSIIDRNCIKNNIKTPSWLIDYKKQDKLVSCLFGEHLLSDYPNNPIGLVEAPKTAIICSLYFGLPKTENDIIWLAVYNKSSFNYDKIKVLKDRVVYVFPDLSKDNLTYNEWKDKAKSFSKYIPKTKFYFSYLLEDIAPEEDKEKGLDIADYLLLRDYKIFKEKVLLKM